MTITLWLLTLSFAPGIFWLIYFYRKDRFEPEPKKQVMKLFLFGILVAVPAILLELPFILFPFCGAVLAAPVIEEFLKYSVVRAFIYNHPDFNEPMDGIVYASAVALGFASIENLFYLATSYATEGFVAVAAFRALLTIPGHALWTSISGAALGEARFSDPARGRFLVFKGVLTAMGCHALFNFLLFFSLPGAVVLLVVVFLTWRMVLRRIKKSIANSPFREIPADETAKVEKG